MICHYFGKNPAAYFLNWETLCLHFFASCPHFPAVHVAHIQGCGDVQHEALEAETEKEEHHGEDDVPQLTAGDMAWFSLC